MNPTTPTKWKKTAKTSI